MPEDWQQVLGLLRRIQWRYRLISAWTWSCFAVAVLTLCLLLAVVLGQLLLLAVPSSWWLSAAEMDPRVHWVADGTTPPGARPSFLLAIIFTLLMGALFWMRSIVRYVRRRRVESPAYSHPLDHAARMLTRLVPMAGENARGLLHLPQNPFHTALAHQTAGELADIRAAQVVRALPAGIATLVMLAALSLAGALVRPLAVDSSMAYFMDAARAVMGHPPHPWLVAAPRDPSVRPFIVMVSALPGSPPATPRMVVESAGRRRVIEMDDIGQGTFMVRFNTIRRSVHVTIIGGGPPITIEAPPPPAGAP